MEVIVTKRMKEMKYKYFKTKIFLALGSAGLTYRQRHTGVTWWV